MRNLIVALLLCTVVSASCLAADVQTSADQAAEKLFLEAKRLQETNGDPGKCLVILRAVVDEHPDYGLVPWAKMRIGKALHDNRQYAEAITACDEVISKYTGDEVARWAKYFKMKSLFRLKRYADGAALAWDLDQTKSAQDPGPVDLERSQAGRWFNQLVTSGSLDSALAAFDVARTDADRMAWIGTIQAYQKTDDSAEKLFLEAKKLQEANGDPGKCLTLFRTIVSEHPNCSLAPWAKMRIGRALYDTAKYEESISACDDVISKYAGQEVARWARYFKMKSLFRLERYSDAAALAWELDQTESYTDHGPVYVERFQAGRWFEELEAKGGFDSALSAFGVNRTQPDKMAWIYMIRVYLKADRREFGEAEARFNELLRVNPNAQERAAEADIKIANSLLQYFCTQKEPGDCSKLLYFLSLPKKLWPNHSLAIAKCDLRMAQYYLNVRKDNASAQNVLEAALQTPPADTPSYMLGEISYCLGQALTAQGKYTRAAELYSAMVQGSRTGWAHAAGYMQADALLKSENTDAAKTVLEETSASVDTDLQWRALARGKLIQVYVKMGNKQRALSMLEEDLTRLQQELADVDNDAERTQELNKKISAINAQIQGISAIEGGTQQ